MLSHVTFPYSWKECSSPESCDESIHLDTALVENVPLEWVSQLLGGCRIEPSSLSWLDEDGKYHREGGPAIVNSYQQGWFQHGIPHRMDGPAVVYPYGSEEWFQNGKRHRTDGPAVTDNEAKHWFINGVRHREDGPAIEYADGRWEWYQHGKQHRMEGPAIMKEDGSLVWCREGKPYRWTFPPDQNLAVR